jgi:hypothetical protein
MIMGHKIKKKIKKERKGKEMIGSSKEVVWEVKKEKGDVILGRLRQTLITTSFNGG